MQVLRLDQAPEVVGGVNFPGGLHDWFSSE